MGRGKAVPPYVKAKIREKRAAGAKIQELMNEFHVSCRTVHRACKLHNSKPKLRGRPFVLSSSDQRRLAARARRHPTETARQLAKKIGVSVSERTI